MSMTGIVRRRLLADGLLAASLAVLGGAARADSYPGRSVHTGQILVAKVPVSGHRLASHADAPIEP